MGQGIDETMSRGRDEHGPMVWQALCLVFRDIDVEFLDEYGACRRFRYSLLSHETEKALWSFRRFPALAEECSGGMADISYGIEYAERPLTSLTSLGYSRYWPSPADTYPELVRYAREYDSVFVLWPQNDSGNNIQVPSAGWGLAISPGHVPGGAAYCSIANAPEGCWDEPLPGEVWLHEWLHGVCDFYEGKGFRMPQHNADGGGFHGYTQSPVTGWGRYYGDLMTGHVLESGRMAGITPEAWRSGTIRSPGQKKPLIKRIFKMLKEI